MLRLAEIHKKPNKFQKKQEKLIMKNQTIFVVGAGILGMMTARELKLLNPKANITVLEKGRHVPNPFSSSANSLACYRGQFSWEYNVALSLCSRQFYREFPKTFHTNAPVLKEGGYLFMHGFKAKWEQAQIMAQNQVDWGLDVKVLSRKDILKMFPFEVDANKVIGATFCQSDGFLDASRILHTLREWLEENGVVFRTEAEVTGFRINGMRVTGVEINRQDTLQADEVVICTGAWSHRVCKLLGFNNILVAPEKRYVYTAIVPSRIFPGRTYELMPMLVCVGEDGEPVSYIKPEPGISENGNRRMILGGEQPTEPQWNFTDDDVHRVEHYFEPYVEDGWHFNLWKHAASFLPFAQELGFEMKVHGGFYETVLHSHCPIVGPFPGLLGAWACFGGSGHGFMHAYAIAVLLADVMSGKTRRLPPCVWANLSFESYLTNTRKVEGMKI